MTNDDDDVRLLLKQIETNVRKQKWKEEEKQEEM